MLTVGLTGGIGSGKSAVSRLLADRGAVVVDADVIAREVVEVGTAGLSAVAQEFGSQVILADGSLDREALGQLVFNDPDALRRLNAVVHPFIGARTSELVELARQAGTEVLVHDVPLLVENGMAGLYDVVVVVTATPSTQLDRLVRLRGLSEQDARSRIGSQAVLADKVAVATHLVHNDGPIRELPPQVDALWRQLLKSAKAREDRTM